MWLELCAWCFMSYTSIYHGKLFDYKHIDPTDFAQHINDGGGNWYYRLMFGHLNLTNIDVDGLRNVQGKTEFLTDKR